METELNKEPYLEIYSDPERENNSNQIESPKNNIKDYNKVEKQVSVDR